LELEKERIQLLCNNLNQYSQHISLFGQTLTTVSSEEFFLSCVFGKTGRKHFSNNFIFVYLGIAVSHTDSLRHQQG
jgi:hypothetical protein